MKEQTHYEGCWREPAHRACAVTEIERLRAESTQARAEAARLRISLVTACVERDILNASELCSETMAELAQARDAQDALARECNQLKADWEDRLAQLKYAEDALAHCGFVGIEADFTGVADAIQQMASYIKERDAECEDAITKVVEARRVARLWHRRAQEQPIEIEITGVEMIEALQAERQLRREAEQRAEALAQLVTPELANLLILLANATDILSHDDLASIEDARHARALAARIREALEAENGN